MESSARKAMQFSIGSGVAFLILMGIIVGLIFNAPCALLLWLAVPFLFDSLWAALAVTGLAVFCLGALVGWIGYKASVMNNKLAKTGAILLIIVICLASSILILPICD